MSNGTTKLSRLALVFAAAASLSVGLSQPASAQNAGKGVVHSSDARVGTFDWLATRGTATSVGFTSVSPRITRQIGNGSWICSPAGFGRKSSCYSN